MRGGLRWRATTLLVLGPLAGCKPVAAPTAVQVEAASDATPAPLLKPGAPFAWRLRAQSPSAAPSDVYPTVGYGPLSKQVAPWSCDYSLEDTNVDGDLTEQFGALACASETSGIRAAALVMCMTSPERPSECGTGNVQVTDADGNVHAFSLSCATAQSDCFTRPEVSALPGEQPPGAGRLRGLAATGPGDADTDDPLEDTPPRARWSVGMYREGFGDRRVVLEDRAGELPSVADAWRCSYAVAAGATSEGVEAEIGTVHCVAKTGERIGTSVVCVDPRGEGGFANAGALRLSGPEAPDIALMLDCKSEPRTAFQP